MLDVGCGMSVARCNVYLGRRCCFCFVLLRGRKKSVLELGRKLCNLANQYECAS